MQEAPLVGDPAALERFAGSWYHEGVGWISFQPRRGTIRCRVPPTARVVDARSVDDEIHFAIEWREHHREVSARLLDEGYLVLVPPGQPVAGCATCKPGLIRFSIAGWMFSRVAYAVHRLERATRPVRKRALDLLYRLHLP